MEEENKDQPTQAKGNNMMLYVALIVVAVLIVGGFLFLSGRSSNMTTSETSTSTEEMSETNSVGESVNTDDSAISEGGQMTDGDVREVTVEGSEYSFNPSSLTVTEGEKIKLTFNNVGNLPHNFVIDELGVATQTVPGGGSDTVEFTATQSGTFDFYCSVGNHRSLGMEGELDVQ